MCGSIHCCLKPVIFHAFRLSPLKQPKCTCPQTCIASPTEAGDFKPFGLVPGNSIGLNRRVICDDRISSVYSLGTWKGGSPPLTDDFHWRVLHTDQKSMSLPALHAPQAMPFPSIHSHLHFFSIYATFSGNHYKFTETRDPEGWKSMYVKLTGSDCFIWHFHHYLWFLTPAALL